MADEKGQKSAKMDEKTTKESTTSSSHNLASNYCDLGHPAYLTVDEYSSCDGYSYHPQGNSFEDNQGYQQQQYEASEERGCWRKLYDYQSGHWYYQNLWTSTTQWTCPLGWETWPLNNQQEDKVEKESTSAKYRKTSEEIEKKNTEYMKRPAKRQVDPEEAKKLHWRPEGANEYNIWYDKWIGDHWKGTKDDGPAETRCCISKDAGYTKATLHDSNRKKNYFCIYFARGCCHLGKDCGFFHLVPTDKDIKRISLIHDIFGRERHKLHSENMGGVGSFEKDCRTLYVGRLGKHYDLENVLWSEFSEWGEIEEIRIIPKRQIAFVRYKNRINSEFAKLAMSDQRLEGQEVLNIRWAYDDPNPRSRKQKLEDERDSLRSAIYEKLEEEPQPKRLCSEGIVGSYPDTDHQYPDSGIGPQTKEQIEQEQVIQQVKKDCSRLDQAFRRLESSNCTRLHMEYKI